MQKEIYLSKDESLDFDTFFEIFENLKKQFFNAVDESRLNFNVDLVFDASTVDNSFDHEFGTEKLTGVELIQKSIMVYITMNIQADVNSKIEIKMKASDMLSVSEYEKICEMCNSYIDNNIQEFVLDL